MLRWDPSLSKIEDSRANQGDSWDCSRSYTCFNRLRLLATMSLERKLFNGDWFAEHDECSETSETMLNGQDLAHFNHDVPIEVNTQGSALRKTSLVLLSSLTGSQCLWVPTDRNLLAVQENVKKRSRFLLERKFVIVTDHERLIGFS